MRLAPAYAAERREVVCLQGKVVDAWSYGLPVATTTVGAEGMLESLYRPSTERSVRA